MPNFDRWTIDRKKCYILSKEFFKFQLKEKQINCLNKQSTILIIYTRRWKVVQWRPRHKRPKLTWTLSNTNLKTAKSQIVIGIKLSNAIITHFVRSVHKANTIVLYIFNLMFHMEKWFNLESFIMWTYVVPWVFHL